MINHTPILFDLPERQLSNIDGSFCVEKNRIHLYLPVNKDIPPYIDSLEGNLKHNGQPFLFFRTQLMSTGDHYDEYWVKEAFIQEDRAGFRQNAYIGCQFALTGNCLPFFHRPWNFTQTPSPPKSQTLVFRNVEDRTYPIQLNPNATLTIRTGYSQQYSKIHYSAVSSTILDLRFKNPVTREIIFSTCEAIASYFSIFCHQPVRVKTLSFFVGSDTIIYYLGQHVAEKDTESYVGCVLVEQSEIRNYSDDSLISWVNDFPKYRTPSTLLRDAQLINDEELRFICLTRALEVFHKEFFFEKAPAGHLAQLYTFLTANKLTKRSSKEFLQKEMTLYKRLYDLLQQNFALVSDTKFRLQLGYLIMCM